MSVLTEEMKKRFKPSCFAENHPGLLGLEESKFIANELIEKLENFSNEERLLISLLEILKQSVDPEALTKAANQYLYSIKKRRKQ